MSAAWIRRAVVALAALVAFGALALDVIDGWRPAGGNGVAWIEAVVRDSPESRVEAYLAAAAGSDRARALELWAIPQRGHAETLAELRERREIVTAELVGKPLPGHRIRSVQWWGTCCEPHVVADPRGASFARVEVVADGERRYTFDVRVAERDGSLLDDLARRWSLVEVYATGEQPVLFRSVQTSTGAYSLGPARPEGVKDCGATTEYPPVEYDDAARECVWSAYSARQPVRWTVTAQTIEGDPVRTTFVAQPGFIVLTRDMTADRFSAPADRRLWLWQCRTMDRRPWVTDPRRSSFELSECSGDGPTATLP